MPAGIRPNLPPTFLVPSSNLPPTFLVPSSYLPPTFLLPSLYLPPTLPVSCSLYPAGGCCARWDTSLGGLPALACVQVAVSRWGCAVHAVYAPWRPSRPPLRPDSSVRWGCAGYAPRRPSCPPLRPDSSVRWGVQYPLGYAPRGLPALVCTLLGVSIGIPYLKASPTPHRLTQP